MKTPCIPTPIPANHQSPHLNRARFVIALVAVITGMQSTSVNAASCAPLPAGLVAWWPGEGNGADVQAGHDGNLAGEVAFAPGVVGRAHSFDGGADSGIAVQDDPAFRLTDSLSIEGWIKITAATDGMILFRGDDRGGLDPYSLGVVRNPTTQLVFQITGASSAQAVISAPVDLDRFIHVAATLDGASGKMKLLLDGMLVASTTTAIRPLGPLDANSNPGIGIGNVQGQPSSPYAAPFHGLIDELRLYNRALTAEEVTGIVEAGSLGTCPANLVLSFSGPNAMATVESSPALQNPDGMTIEAWLLPESTTGNFAQFVNKSDGLNDATARSYEVRWAPHGSEYGTGSRIESIFFVGVEHITVLGAQAFAGEWVHVSATYDRQTGTHSLYTNGVLAASTSLAVGGTPLAGMPVRQTQLPVAFGRLPAFSNSQATGSMDEVRIWSRVRSPDEILADFACRLTGSENGLAGYWNFDAGVMEDLSGLASDGTLTGGAQIETLSAPDPIHSGCHDPRFLVHPRSTVVLLNSPAMFEAVATGSPPLAYQWLHNGTNLPAATNATLQLTAVTAFDAGFYQLEVVNTIGSARSEIARLVVYSPAVTSVPIPLVGWNRDWVSENSPTPYSDGFVFGGGSPSMFEAGLGDHFDGLPASRSFVSAVDPTVRFEFQPYDAKNVLFLTSGGTANRTGVLTLIQPLRYSRLQIVAASGAGSGDGSLVVNFTDGTSSAPLPFLARDYYAGTNDYSRAYPRRRPAITGLGRNTVSGSSFVYQRATYGFEFHQTDIDLPSMGLHRKAIQSLTFMKPSTGPEVMFIWAASGEVNPSGTFGTPVVLSDGTVLLDFVGEPGVIHRIEGSTDLIDWTPIISVPGQDQRIQLIDPAAVDHPHRFYRAVIP